MINKIFVRTTWLAGLVALGACGTVGGADKNTSEYNYLHRPEYGFVRIEPIETGAADNMHPATISVETLRAALADLKSKGAILSDDKPIFAAEELSEIVPPLVQGLAQAGTKQDLTFAVVGRHGWLGKNSAKTVTTGRVFVRDGKLNVIFGTIHDAYERRDWETNMKSTFVPGRRAKQTEYTLKLSPASTRIADKRSDWAIIELAAITPERAEPPASVVAPAAGAVDQRVQDVEQRLRILDQLKAKGLVTDEEYRDRRRAVLEGI